MKVAVLGAGRVGSAIAIDLARGDGFEVRVADRDPRNLAPLEDRFGIPGERVDFSLPTTVDRAVRDVDLVVSAVPGFLGFQNLRTVIEAGRNVVDIAFFPEDPFALAELAEEKGVTAMIDCGVAPGMSNLLIGHVDALLDRTEAVSIYVGGLPVERDGLYDYRTVFSPIDVIEEYTRPARLVENGHLVVRPALSDIERLTFPEVGELEAFNTDGLRTLLRTIGAQKMVEKTLRYPGHAEKMCLLRDTGFFSADPFEVNGQEIRPIDFTTALLFPLWRLREGEEDVTVMRIVVEGVMGSQRVRYTYELMDPFDRVTHTTSMARTTAYTATAAVRMLVAGLYAEPGITPLEIIGRDAKCVEYILDDLRDRGIEYRETIVGID